MMNASYRPSSSRACVNYRHHRAMRAFSRAFSPHNVTARANTLLEAVREWCRNARAEVRQQCATTSFRAEMLDVAKRIRSHVTDNTQGVEDCP
jgi:hypothetical protein